MLLSEYKALEVGDIVRWGWGDLFPVDNLSGDWGIHADSRWVIIQPKLLDGWTYVGKEFVPKNENGHCWHYTGPSLVNYKYVPDFTCCLCGMRKVAQPKFSAIPNGHGKFYPHREIVHGLDWYGNKYPCDKGEEGYVKQWKD